MTKYRQNKNSWKAALLAALLLINTTACVSGEESSSDDSDSTASIEDAFPAQLAVSSPFDTTDEEVSSSESAFITSGSGSSSSSVKYYAWATGRIDLLLAGSSPSICTFDPELFLTEEEDASCYGPEVAYESHPDTDVTDPDFDGALPTGDVGIWLESEPSGEACASAQLNTRMESVRDKSVASLMGLASMVCVINANGHSMPSSSSLDLTSDMNALGVTDTSFTTATISHSVDSSGNDVYSYELDLTYAPADSYDIVVNMEHIPGSSSGAYTGKLSYLVNDTFMGGHCPTQDVTINGSLEYDRNSSSDISVEVRNGMFCDHDSDGRDSDGLVDPSVKLSSDPNGWANNFSIFTANYDPSTLDGNYAYSWQAGYQDQKSRSLNIIVDTDSSTSIQGAEAFYGYGDDIETTDGSIDGFICNWAGPNNDHTIIDAMQYQEVSFDSSLGLFVSDAANIEYAPIVDCEYDGSGSLIVDLDADGDLSDESHVTIADDLLDAQDVDGDGLATVEETISDSGFTLPTM